MSALSVAFGQSLSRNPLRVAFLKWQCRVRQLAMRNNAGRPDEGITPTVFLRDEEEPAGHIITVLSKAPGFSVTSELEFIAAKTFDPAQRREKAIEFLSSVHYQKAAEFSDILTATFPPNSDGAAKLRRAETVVLKFDAFSQKFDLVCKVWRLTPRNPLYQSTIAHNRLFNPNLHPDTIVLGFEPDWTLSKSDPPTG